MRCLSRMSSLSVSKSCASIKRVFFTMCRRCSAGVGDDPRHQKTRLAVGAVVAKDRSRKLWRDVLSNWKTRGQILRHDIWSTPGRLQGAAFAFCIPLRALRARCGPSSRLFVVALCPPQKRTKALRARRGPRSGAFLQPVPVCMRGCARGVGQIPVYSKRALRALVFLSCL